MSTEVIEGILLKCGDLIEGVIVGPHPLLDSLTEVNKELCVICPVSAEGYLEESSDDTGCVLFGQLILRVVTRSAYLSDICRVGYKRKVLQEYFRNVCL